MAYIMFVNPAILEKAGMDHGVVFVATRLAAAASTAIMGLYANYPIALAPGMGLNAYMATSLGAIAWDEPTEYIPALIVALMIPLSYSIATGIGLGFIALCGAEAARRSPPRDQSRFGLIAGAFLPKLIIG